MAFTGADMELGWNEQLFGDIVEKEKGERDSTWRSLEVRITWRRHHRKCDTRSSKKRKTENGFGLLREIRRL